MTLLILIVIYFLLPVIFGIAAHYGIYLKDLFEYAKKTPYTSVSIIIILLIAVIELSTNAFENAYLYLYEYLKINIKFVRPESGLESSIFGFSEFISALALLFILYTITGIRYKFRIAVAPIPIFKISYFLIIFVGLGTLLMDIWFSKRWAMPEIISDYSLWQGVFGFIFFMIAMTWVFFAYIKPPYFTKYNYKVFSGELYRVILKGADDELKVIANELARSIESLIIYADSSTKNMKLVKRKDEVIKIKPSAGAYANDMLLLIGNRKFCRYIVSSSPITAITLFEVMSSKKIYNLPIGQFSTNIATEAIMNKDSILYHEDEGYRSGLIGYQKPFSKALYGDYALVESIGHNSPLDVNHRLVFSWDASQLNAYCRLVLLTLESYLIKTVWFNHSFVLNRAFRKIENSCLDIYKVNDDLSNSYSSDAYKRLEVVVDFVVQAISMVNDLNANHVVVLRPRADTARQNIYDHIAGMMFEIIFHVSSVNGDSFSVWNIQHNIVWSKFFHNHAKGKAWDIIQFKLRRLLYNEIISLEEWPNYKSSRILGYCLYVMGFNISKKSSRNTSYIALNKVIISWVKNNYLNLRRVNIDVAESCLIGRISYDEEHNRLVKTYEKGLSRKPAKSYLDL